MLTSSLPPEALQSASVMAPLHVEHTDDGRLVDRKVPRTHTTALRTLTLIVFVLSFASATMQLISVGTDDMVHFSLSTGVTINDSRLLNESGRTGHGRGDGYRTSSLLPPIGRISSSGPTGTGDNRADSHSDGTAFVPLQILPQVDVTVGFSQTCFGFQCVERASVPEVLPIVLTAFRTTQAKGGLQPPALQHAYASLVYQFATGFDMNAATCLRGTDEIISARLLSVFGIAAGSLAAIFLSATLVLSAYQTFLLARMNVLAGRDGLYADIESEIMKFGSHQVSLQYLQQELNMHARRELPILIALIVMVLLSFVFSVAAMASGITLYNDKLRCGRSFCATFSDASAAFFTELSAALGEDAPYSAKCDRGVSFGTGVVAFAICAIMFVLGILLAIVYFTSGRHRALARRKHAVDTLAVEVALLKEDPATQQNPNLRNHVLTYSTTAVSMLGSRQVSMKPVDIGRDSEMARYGGLAGPLGGVTGIRDSPSLGPANTDKADIAETVFRMSEPRTPPDDGLAVRRRHFDLEQLPHEDAPQLEPGHEHTLGGRIAMLRQRKALMAEEEQDRATIKRTQALHFGRLQKKEWSHRARAIKQ